MFAYLDNHKEDILLTDFQLRPQQVKQGKSATANWLEYTFHSTTQCVESSDEATIVDTVLDMRDAYLGENMYTFTVGLKCAPGLDTLRVLHVDKQTCGVKLIAEHRAGCSAA